MTDTIFSFRWLYSTSIFILIVFIVIVCEYTQPLSYVILIHKCCGLMFYFNASSGLKGEVSYDNISLLVDIFYSATCHKFKQSF